MFGYTLVSTARLKAIEETIAELKADKGQVATNRNLMRRVSALEGRMDNVTDHVGKQDRDIHNFYSELDDLRGRQAALRKLSTPNACAKAVKDKRNAMIDWEHKEKVLINNRIDALRYVEQCDKDCNTARGIIREAHPHMIWLNHKLRGAHVDLQVARKALVDHQATKPLTDVILLRHKRSGCIGLHKLGTDRISIIREGVGGCLKVGDIITTTAAQVEAYWDIRTDNLQVVVNV